jgi:hypothetical protein
MLSCFAAIALPTIVLLSGFYELFPVPGWVDPMIYVGYFIDPAEQIWRYGPLYYSGRVPYIFVGHIFYSVFNPAAAHYAMVLFFNGLALGAVFLAAHRLYRRDVAILATWWLGLNPLWVNAISTGYVDGPAMTFGFVAFACAVFGATRWRSTFSDLSFVASGFFVSAATITHPIPGGIAALAVFVICFALKDERTFLRDLACVVVGGVLGLVASTVYAWSLGAPTIYSFFRQSPMVGLSLGNTSPFTVPFGEWASGSFWALMPLFLVFLSFRILGKKTTPFALVGVICLTLTFAILLFWDVAFGGTTLQKHFYVSYFIFGQTILVASIFGSIPHNMIGDGIRKIGIYLVMIAVVVVLLVYQYLPSVPEITLSRDAKWAVLVALGCMVFIFLRSQRIVAAMASAMALTMLSGILNVETRSAFSDARYPAYKLVFEDVMAIRKVADMTYLRGRNVFVWGNRQYGFSSVRRLENERLSYGISYAGKYERMNELDSLAALWAWDRGALGFDMPNISKVDVTRLQRSKNVGSVIIVCSRELDCDLGVAALNDAGVATSIRARTTVWTPGISPRRVIIADF